MLAPLGALGSAHHERLDGSGYHRGLPASGLSAPARLMAAANAWCALTVARPRRPRMTESEAASSLAAQGKEGLLDRRAVDAVLTATCQRGAQTRRAASMEPSEREVDALRNVAREETNASIGKTLGLSPKTVGFLRHGIGCRPRSAWWLLPTTMPWSPSSATASGSRAPPELRQAGPLRPPSRRTPATLPSTEHATGNRRREWPNRP